MTDKADTEPLPLDEDTERFGPDLLFDDVVDEDGELRKPADPDGVLARLRAAAQR